MNKGAKVRQTQVAMAVVLMGLASVAHSQAATPMAPAPSPVFAIKGFKITGDNPLGDGDTTRILAPFLRTDASIETLQKATAALEAALRDKGFGLHRVALPPQEVGDTVTLDIVKFTISKVTVDGNKLNDEVNVRRSVPELREGHTPNFKKMAIQTAIANENPNKQIQVGIKEGDEPDKIDATISVKETRPWTFSLGLSNAGSQSSGRDRFTVAGGHTNLFNRDHQFTGAYTTSLQRTSDVKQLGLSYRIPVYEWGGVIGASYTRSDVVGNFGAFTSTGAGHTLGLNYTAYLPPNGGRRSYVTLGFDDKVFDPSKINDIPVPGQLTRRSRPVTLGYTARTESDNAFWGYNAELAVNTSSGRGNDLASYQTEDPRITTTRWKALRAGLNYSAGFAGNWIWGARGQFQYSPDVLISGEQFGIGGVSSVRGSRSERPVSGDRGLSMSVEVTTPELTPGLRLVGFVDAGWLGNNNSNGANKPSSDRLAGIGLGLRYGSGPVSLTADYGRLVRGSVVPLSINSGSPQKGDDKLYVNLSVRF
ncbi:MAG: ShlB/FhaC/HecB family hemolysin secretion/activation protein [Ramlibacter sp.]|nr:ShlB/FhaC/HecB family hemolysin secretion/activation protein [Ramlibacter sp.]